jgi:hypothetical protein
LDGAAFFADAGDPGPDVQHVVKKSFFSIIDVDLCDGKIIPDFLHACEETGKLIKEVIAGFFEHFGIPYVVNMSELIQMESANLDFLIFHGLFLFSIRKCRRHRRETFKLVFPDGAIIF